jgi:hypothetical protein
MTIRTDILGLLGISILTALLISTDAFARDEMGGQLQVSGGFAMPAAATRETCRSATGFDSNLSQLKKVLDEVADVNECKKPIAPQDIRAVCESLKFTTIMVLPNGKKAIKYKELLWSMACVEQGEDRQSVNAKKKLQAMWEKNKKNFRCSDFAGVPIPDLNIIQFSLELGKEAFLDDLAEFGLDVYYTPKSITGKDEQNILDFIDKRVVELERGLQPEKANTYRDVKKVLLSRKPVEPT